MVKNKEEIDIDYNNEAVREVYKYNANSVGTPRKSVNISVF